MEIRLTVSRRRTSRFGVSHSPRRMSTQENRGYRPIALTFDCVSVAEGRAPSGFAAFTGHSPDGSRRSANKVSASWLSPDGYLKCISICFEAKLSTKVVCEQEQ